MTFRVITNPLDADHRRYSVDELRRGPDGQEKWVHVKFFTYLFEAKEYIDSRTERAHDA